MVNANVQAQVEALKARGDDNGVQSATDFWSSVAVTDDGVRFENVQQVFSFAKWVCRAGLCVKGDSPDQVTIKILFGRDLGLGWSAAIRGVAVVNGNPSVYGRVMLAICQRSPFYDHGAFKEWFENEPKPGEPFADNCTAHCQCRRKPDGVVQERTFSVADAKRAGLWDRQSSTGAAMPWKLHPKAMLAARARDRVHGVTFAPELQGLYSAEEMASADVFLARMDQVGEKAAALAQQDASPGSKARAAITERLADRKGNGNGQSDVEPERPPSPPLKPDPPREPEPPLPPEPEPKRDPTANEVEAAECEGIRQSIRYAFRVMNPLQVSAALNRARLLALTDIDNVSARPELEEIEAAVTKGS
ncbi:MAG: hypothetical protein ABII82_06760 [Verrucomicrobiota bacterium]